MTMTRSDARAVAEKYLQAKQPTEGIELVILEAETLERAFGWVFFYDSKRHIETGSFRDAIAGNAPLVVTKADGRVHETGTAHPLEHYLEEFE